MNGEQDIFEMMETLRGDGWCLILKALPRELSFVIEGSRSEYDAPCPDREIGKGKWCCEAHDMRWRLDSSKAWRNDVVSFGDDPRAAVRDVFRKANEETKRRDEQRIQESKT